MVNEFSKNLSKSDKFLYYRILGEELYGMIDKIIYTDAWHRFDKASTFEQKEKAYNQYLFVKNEQKTRQNP